jgi:hypothetical protein
MPKGRKRRGASLVKDKEPRPTQGHKGLGGRVRKVLGKVPLKLVGDQVKAARAKVKERVKAGVKANRKVGAHIRNRALELRERLAEEAKRRLDIERSIAQKDEELKALEMRLERLDTVEAITPMPKKGKATVDEMGHIHPVNINTSKDKHQDRVSGRADKHKVKGYRDLLEKRLVVEDEELALVQEQLSKLKERERCLDERENKLQAVERQLKDGACSPDVEEGIKEMREGLQERLSILEQRSKKLDMVETELAKMERFVDAQKSSLDGHRKGKGRKAPAPKGRPARRRSSEEEE